MAGDELLSDRLQRGPLPVEQAVDIARQIASTLAAAHAVSSIHRALEPSKIRLASDGVKLVDFDPATAALRTGLASPRYVAPECTSTTQADRYNDVFALGCILFDMVCGHLPVELRTTIAAMLSKTATSRPAMSEIVQQLAAVPATAPATPAPAPAPAVATKIDTATADLAQLNAQLDRCNAAKEWPNVIALIDRIVELEGDPIRRGRYCLTGGMLVRDELAAPSEAVDRFDYALDSFFADPAAITESTLPVALRAFTAIEQILTRAKDWKALERMTRKMAHRVKNASGPPLAKVRVELFDKLGEIYRTRLDHASAAFAAFEIAQQMDPSNEVKTEGIDRVALLAELRAAGANP